MCDCSNPALLALNYRLPTMCNLSAWKTLLKLCMPTTMSTWQQHPASVSCLAASWSPRRAICSNSSITFPFSSIWPYISSAYQAAYRPILRQISASVIPALVNSITLSDVIFEPLTALSLPGYPVWPLDHTPDTTLCSSSLCSRPLCRPVLVFSFCWPSSPAPERSCGSRSTLRMLSDRSNMDFHACLTIPSRISDSMSAASRVRSFL